MIAVDLFAGGGGASLGIQWATGHAPIMAVNHCRAAIEMHAANHPGTLHLHESVWDVHAQDFAGTPVDLLWASPDCTHFSRAKGKAPRSKEIRSLAWVIVDWAAQVRPTVIAGENVPEFLGWGPCFGDSEDVPEELRNQPIPERRGETFDAFRLALGPGVPEDHPSWGEIPERVREYARRGCGYDLRTAVLKACDYGAPTSRPRMYFVARRDGAPIGWPEPTHGPGRALPWRTAAECIDWTIPVPSIFDRARPLAEATQRRIAEGIRRYVLNSASPYLLCLTHGGRLEPIDQPLRTTTTTHRGERALIVPSLINTRNGERAGQTPRALDITRPMSTVTGQGSQGALVAAFLARHNGGPNGHPSYGRDLRETMGTVTGRDTQALAAVWLDKLHGSARAGQPLDLPAPTVTSGGGRGGGHAALCAAFLLKYYGQGGQWSALDEPMHTLVGKARMGLVTVTLGGEEYALVDIGMRMLQPRELARAQGFPDSYILTGTKSEQVARIGNSVCPPVAEALVRAQFPSLARRAA